MSDEQPLGYGRRLARYGSRLVDRLEVRQVSTFAQMVAVAAVIVAGASIAAFAALWFLFLKPLSKLLS